MKKPFLILSLVTCLGASGQNNTIVPTKIESARIYTNGAELKHKANVQIQAGPSEIILTNVADYLNENTISIKVPKHVTIMSAQFTNAYIQETSDLNPSEQKTIRTEIENKQKELEKTRFMITTEEKGIELLDSNRTISNSQTFSVNEIRQWFTYYKNSRLETLNKISGLKEIEKKLSEEIKALNGRLQISQTTEKNYSQGKIILHINSAKAGAVQLDVSYLTNNANWSPSYELNIEKVNDPIQFYYQAQVRQNTGLDWKNIMLTLISSPANQSSQAPRLNTWFINYETPIASVPANAYAKIKSIQQEKAYADEVVLEAASISQYTAINQSQLSVTFDISIPYTILSNNKNHLIKLDKTDINAKYQYISIPKLDPNAYLLAKIKDYGDYNILPGEANVILEDLFVGETYLDPEAAENELVLSIGKDPNILVNRKKLNDKSKTNFLSSKKVQDFVFEISVRNNKKEAISIEIEDNYPISSNIDIEVVLTDKDGASVNTETGKLTWDLNLKPNETKKIKFGYQIKSAKDKNIRL